MIPIEATIAGLQTIAAEVVDPEVGVWTGLSAVLTFDAEEGDEGPETVLFLQERINGVTVWGSVDGRDEWTEEQMAAYLTR